jgi:hypothetical protein
MTTSIGVSALVSPANQKITKSILISIIESMLVQNCSA